MIVNTNIFEEGSPWLLDGGLATALEAQGLSVHHDLWSAHVALTNPDAVVAVHAAYLQAGADIVSTAGYQASLRGLVQAGFSATEAAVQYLHLIDLAADCRDAFASSGLASTRRPPLVAASMGPYGAYLADGSEYRGQYGLDAEALRAFHLPQWELVLGSRADLIACETVPSALEARVLADLFRGHPTARGWISFSCRDSEHISDGTALADVVAELEGIPGLLAFGINCTAPRHVTPLLQRVRSAGLALPAVVYPNSGEAWDARARAWKATAESRGFALPVAEWVELGAVAIGGCCRVGPAEIAGLRRQLDGADGGGA